MPEGSLLYRLWAKTNELAGDDVDVGWTFHPLVLHLIDVGLVADAWLREDQLLFERFCFLWPEADPKAIRRALVLTAAAHDVGKLYPAFQAKSLSGWRHGYGTVWSGPVPDGRGFDHGAGTARVFATYDLFGPPKDVNGNWLTLLPMLRVGAGHHGTLYPDERVRDDDRVLGQPHFRDLIPLLLGEVAYYFGAPPSLPSQPPNAFLLLTAGFVAVADWLGSNTDSFPATQTVTTRAQADRYLNRHRLEKTAERGLRDTGLIASFRPAIAFQDLFGPKDNGWRPKPGFQASACAIPFGRAEGSEIAVVEAPMGLGKTEIALFFAAQSLRHGTAAGVYVALPTQATSNALYDRVKSFADRVKADEDVALVLAHGAKDYYRDYRALRDKTRVTIFDRQRRALRGDPTPASEVIAPAWVQPSKRALLAPLGLGTVDQALLAAMGVKHGFVRLFGLAKKVIVLDEVHAYDVYMGALLEHLLMWLGALGAKVILLSATLPAGLRAKLLDAYGVVEAPVADSYPQLLHAARSTPATIVDDPTPDVNRQTRIIVEPVVAEGDSDQRMAAGVEWTLSKLKQGGCIAWIRNTVREAQAAAAALREAGLEADLLHARFVRRDRNEKEAKLLARFGPPAPDNPLRPDSRVVVATQVIEQSVDVDFDAMLSDLAPVDLLLQRAGRLHRHEREGMRHGHDSPVLGVLMPGTDSRRRLDFGNSVYVYDADTLARSATLVLENTEWVLPAACRSLVAALYDRTEEYWTPDRLAVDPDALAVARERLKSRRQRMEHAALRTLLTAPDQFPVMRDPRHDRSDAGEFVALTTRYAAHSAVAVLFVDGPAGPTPLGAAEPISVPEENDWKGRLDAEEAIAFASVSFPWYGTRLMETEPPAKVASLCNWWRDTHPYDDRLFLVLDENGVFEHESVRGRYSPETGLSVARTKDTPMTPEPAPLEEL